MQESFSAPNWIHTAFGLLAAFLTGGGFYKLLNTWLNRKKPAAEIHLTEATAAEIHVRAGSAAGQAMVRFMDRLDVAQATIDRLRSERDSEKLRADRAEDEAKTARMFVDQLNAAAKLSTCEHYPTGVKLSNYTPQQLNPPKE